MKKLAKILLVSSLVVAFGTLVGCDNSKPNIEPIQEMMDQENIKPQEGDDFFKDMAGGARVPPEETQPVGFKPYRFAKDPEGAKGNKNPMASDMSPEVLKVGQKYFETNCTVCHGTDLNGDGPISAKYPIKIPPLNNDKIKGWSDGQIYHVISAGQGLMGPYASHIPQNSRWQVVNYIRFLQKEVK